jgi:drug/metabolite transporter (DMT)-like permease
MLTAMIMMSMTFIWFKLANRQLHPFSIVLFRLVMASAFLLVLSVLGRNLQKIAKRDLKYFLLLTIFTPVGYFIFEGLGLSLVSASLGSVIIATIPLFIPIGAALFLNERVTVFNILGIFVSFGGVMLVILEKGFRFSASPVGVIFMMFAVFMAVSYTILIKRLSNRYNAFSLTVWQNILGIPFFIPLFIVFGAGDLSELLSDTKLLMPVFYLGILGSAISFIFFNHGIKVLGATRAESFTYLIPVLTTVFAYFGLGENIDIQKIIGIFIVLTGVFLTQLRTGRGTKPAL